MIAKCRQFQVLLYLFFGLLLPAVFAAQTEKPLEKPITVQQGGVIHLQVDVSAIGGAPQLSQLTFSSGAAKHGVKALPRKAPVFLQKDQAKYNVANHSVTVETLMPIEVSDPLGSATLSLIDAHGNIQTEYPVKIESGHFRRQNIQVSSQTKGLEPEPGELEAVAKLKNETGSQKYWQFPLITPTPDCANSPFGVLRYHNGVYTGNYHKGLDFRSPMGRPVRATSGGEVKIAKKMRLHGGTVGLDHGQGLSSIYIHLSKIMVKTGQHVQAGEVIGEVGATGFATGPHLHWGVFANGVPINPLKWLPQAKTCF
ncbi:MAG: M23 family metallopeptidase [Cyanobacteria bacterium]|nr:M23 family metallopeptidase [Cyanobacteriota bacterium]